jgi:hypothetical protein
MKPIVIFLFAFVGFTTWILTGYFLTQNVKTTPHRFALVMASGLAILQLMLVFLLVPRDEAFYSRSYSFLYWLGYWISCCSLFISEKAPKVAEMRNMSEKNATRRLG